MPLHEATMWFFSSGLKSSDPKARRRAVEKLAGDPRHVVSITNALHDKNPAVRQAAAQAIAKYDQFDFASEAQFKAVQQELVRILRDPVVDVRLCAALTLRKLNWKPATDPERATFEIALGNPKGALVAGEAAIGPLLAELKHQ